MILRNEMTCVMLAAAAVEVVVGAMQQASQGDHWNDQGVGAGHRVLAVEFFGVRREAAQDEFTTTRHGLLGVAHKVAKEPADLIRIDGNARQVLLHFDAVMHAGRTRMVLEELLDEFAWFDVAFDRCAAAGKGEELLHQVLSLQRRLLRGGEFRDAVGVAAQAHLGER